MGHDHEFVWFVPPWGPQIMIGCYRCDYQVVYTAGSDRVDRVREQATMEGWTEL